MTCEFSKWPSKVLALIPAKIEIIEKVFLWIKFSKTSLQTSSITCGLTANKIKSKSGSFISLMES